MTVAAQTTGITIGSLAELGLMGQTLDIAVDIMRVHQRHVAERCRRCKLPLMALVSCYERTPRHVAGLTGDGNYDLCDACYPQEKQ